jgi:hypothetical protein
MMLTFEVFPSAAGHMSAVISNFFGTALFVSPLSWEKVTAPSQNLTSATSSMFPTTETHGPVARTLFLERVDVELPPHADKTRRAVVVNAKARVLSFFIMFPMWTLQDLKR